MAVKKLIHSAADGVNVNMHLCGSVQVSLNIYGSVLILSSVTRGGHTLTRSHFC